MNLCAGLLVWAHALYVTFHANQVYQSQMYANRGPLSSTARPFFSLSLPYTYYFIVSMFLTVLKLYSQT
jgi:hypothetical protein